MKRALFTVVAALVVLLSYPSTHSLAGTNGQALNKGASHPVAVGRYGGPYGGPIGAGTSDSNDGDADGLAGIRGGTHPGLGDGLGSSSMSRNVKMRTLLRMWWNISIFFHG